MRAAILLTKEAVCGKRTGDQRERANADVSTGRRSSAVAGSLRELFLAADA